MNDNGSGPTVRPSPVPLIRFRSDVTTFDEIALQAEVLRDRAEREGQTGVAYCFEVARMEAQLVADQARRDEAERLADPRELWRPEETG